MGEKIYSKKNSSIEFSNITINTDQCGWLVAPNNFRLLEFLEIMKITFVDNIRQLISRKGRERTILGE